MKRRVRLRIKKASEAYIEKAKKLTEEEVEKLQSRMRSKLTRRSEEINRPDRNLSNTT